jgi:hypothetical protein
MTDWRDLARQGRFEEAESSMLEETAKPTGYGYEFTARAGFYEEWGDRADSREEAKKNYAEALRNFQIFASGATSGGEGTARMIDVKRLQKKLDELK